MAGKSKFVVLLSIFLLISNFALAAADDEEEEEETASAPDRVSILGKYQLTKSENFDEYLKALGVAWPLRQIATIAKPVLELTEENKVYTLKTITSVRTTSITFKLGEEFDETTLDDRKCKSKVVLEGETKLIHTQVCDGKEYKLVREFTSTEMIGTTELDGVKVHRIYTRVEDEDEGAKLVSFRFFGRAGRWFNSI